MKRVAFVVHAGRAAALEAARGLVAKLAGRALTRQLPNESIGAEETADEAQFAKDVGLVVSVGGDGTFLRAARIAFDQGCPVLGVKVGRVGFLTEAEPPDAHDLIVQVLEGKARIEERMVLVAETGGAPGAESQWALNEVIVEKRARHRLIKLAVRVDGEDVTTFSADGVIVSTATGSTAYSFSARGPIVTPTLRCMVVTPVAAHMVFDRSIVLAPEERVTLDVVGEEPGVMSADGRESVELPVGSSVRIAAAGRPSLLVRRPDAPSFFALVRDKFGLPGGSR